MIRALGFAAALLLAPALGLASPLSVTTARVAFSEAQVPLALTGLIASPDMVTAGFPNPGQILAVHAQAGSQVAAGDLLAEQDPTQAREALRAAEAAEAAASAALHRQEQQLARERTLSDQGYVAEVQLDQGEEVLVVARAALRQARSRTDAARRALEDTRLLAPAAAVVLQRHAEAGQVVGAAQPVLDLAGLGGRDAVFVAPADYDLSGLPGRVVTLRSMDPPGRSYTARIYQVAPMVDPATGGIRVKARLEEESPDLALGEPVSGDLPFALGRQAELPARALTRDGRGPAVWVLDAAGEVVLTPVQVRHYSSDAVYISAGLQDGQQVVVQGAAQLFAGRAVRVMDQQE